MIPKPRKATYYLAERPVTVRLVLFESFKIQINHHRVTQHDGDGGDSGDGIDGGDSCCYDSVVGEGGGNCCCGGSGSGVDSGSGE